MHIETSSVCCLVVNELPKCIAHAISHEVSKKVLTLGVYRVRQKLPLSPEIGCKNTKSAEPKEFLNVSSELLVERICTGTRSRKRAEHIMEPKVINARTCSNTSATRRYSG